MKAARLTAFGVPYEVVECADVADVGEPGDGEVVVEVEGCSINPADLLIIEGRYPSDLTPTAPLGIEGAGRIVAVGDGVGDLVVGDGVMSLGRANWVQKLRLKAEQVIKLPAGVDILQAAMLKANPASAQLMLRDYVDLAEGDWVIQNAANSGVGVNLIRLARARGIRTVNVVRRESLVQKLKAIGADVVLVDGDGLAERVRTETRGASILLAIDAVAGPATLRLAECLADGTLGVEIEATYPLDRVNEAMEHAAREGRGGKILLTPN